MTNTLENLREKIDMVDQQLLTTIEQRLNICKEVALHKKEQHISMMQPGRVEAIMQKVASLAQQKDINEKFIVGLYQLIIGECCRLEDEIIGQCHQQD